MAIVGLSKIKSAIQNGVDLHSILTPSQYDAYLMLQKMRAAVAANHDPSKPLPNILRLVPAPTTAPSKAPLPKPTKRVPAAAPKPKTNKRKRPRPRPVLAPLLARPLPQECRDILVNKGVVLDDGNFRLIFVRRLFNTDVSDHHTRLAMPNKQVREEFLTADEKEAIRGKDEEGLPRKLSVRVIEPSLKEQTMCLAKWNRDAGPGKSWWYALNSDWKVVVLRNKLVKGDVIQVWSFRIEGELGFLIHKTESAPTGDGDDDVVRSDGSGSSGDQENKVKGWASKKRRGFTGRKHHSILGL